MRFRVLCFGVVCCLCALSPARAGAWLHPQGRGQAIFTMAFAEARKAFDASGRLVDTPRYRKSELRAYVEHGVTDWLNVTGEFAALEFRGAAVPSDHLELLIAEAKAELPLSTRPPPGPAYTGLGLVAIGARLKLFTLGNYAFAVEGGVRGASPAARRFLDMRDRLQPEVRLLMGRSYAVFGMPGFLEAQLGYRARGQNGDEIRVDTAVGLRPFERLTLLAQSFSAVAPRGGAASIIAAQKIQLSAIVDVTPSISLQVGVAKALGGVNAPAERGVTAGLWWRY
jgi:hypothetical protein